MKMYTRPASLKFSRKLLQKVDHHLAFSPRCRGNYLCPCRFSKAPAWVHEKCIQTVLQV